MANTHKNISISEDTVRIDDRTGGKLLLISNAAVSFYLILVGAKALIAEKLDVMSGLMLGLGILLAMITIFSILRISHKKTIALEDIDSLSDKTAFTGHRSLHLKLRNGRTRNLYLEPGDIPQVINELNQYGLKVT